MTSAEPGAAAAILPMALADLDEVVALEQAGFGAPWPRQLFVEELARDVAHLDVLRQPAGGPLLGFVNYWIVAGEAQLHQICTAVAARRRGHGAALLAHVIATARERGCERLLLEVRPGNTAARRLYRRHGFQEVGRRARYYADDGEDALVLALELAPGIRPAAK